MHCSSKNQSGYTIVELLVSISITAILGVTIVTFMVSTLTQNAISSTRSKVSSSLQTALVRVNDSVRNSTGVLPYNSTDDPNAPSGSEWTSGATVLVLSARAVKTDGSLYDSTSSAYNSNVFYINEGTLYKRVIAYQDPDNSIQTATCGTTTAIGGCPSDTVIASDVSEVNFIYYTKTGSETTEPMLATSVKTKLSLKTVRSGQEVRLSDSAMMTPRLLSAFADYAPFTAGLGGVSMNGQAGINGGPGTSIYSSGGLNLGQNSFVGTLAAPVTRINVANKSCGVNAGYGASCSPAEPITTAGNSVADSTIYAGRLCAKDQVSGTPDSAYNKMGVYGLVPGCSPNFRLQPLFDKSAHVARMTTPAIPSISCQATGPYGCQGPVDLPANKKINGNITATGNVTVTIKGDLYITGEFIMGDSSPGQTILAIDPAVTKRPVVVVNGHIRLDRVKIQANSQGITPIFVSFWSADSTVRSQNSSYITQDPQLIYSTLNMSFGTGMAIQLNGLNRSYDGSFYAYFGGLTTGIGTTINGTVAAQHVVLGYNALVNLQKDPWNNL